MTLKNNRAPLLCYLKLCASFRSHWWIQTGVTVENPNLGQIRRFLEPRDLEILGMTLNKAKLMDLIAATGPVILLKFDPNHRFFSPCYLGIRCMTSKNNGAPLLYYIKLFKSIGEFKLRLHSGNAQFGSKSTIFCPLWPWNLIGDLGKQ